MCHNVYMKKVVCVLLLYFVMLPCYAKRKHYEAVYQDKWCTEMCGKQEYELNDFTRVDCLTKTHAIEFDFANKVYEGLGQALYYGIKTKKKPGLVLILENPDKESKYVYRMIKVARKKDIDCWVMYESDLYDFSPHPVKLK